MKTSHLIIFASMLALTVADARAQPEKAPPAEAIIHKDLVYADVGDTQLKLDLYLPLENKSSKPFPLIIWIHGGGWMKGSKTRCFPYNYKFTDRGYAIASIEYRLVNKAVFPAQLEDCKTAVRWLRTNAKKYNIDPDHIGAWGSSAGAHLSMLLGLTGDGRKFEAGAHLEISSRVQAVVSYYGPVDLTGKHAQMGHLPRYIPGLLGGPIEEKMNLAVAASPLTHVSKNAAPTYIIHGSADETVPVAQAKAMQAAMGKAGASCKLQIIEGGKHGGKNYTAKKLLDAIDAYLAEYLKSPPAK